jgi:hypothetical protein
MAAHLAMASSTARAPTQVTGPPLRSPTSRRTCRLAAASSPGKARGETAKSIKARTCKTKDGRTPWSPAQGAYQ